jgi:xanthine/CO dehydrogenase XdhC/CoxF family maturation factor
MKAKALITPKTKLTVTVNHAEGSGKVKVVSHVSVLADGLAVAIGTLGGKYTEEQALQELRKFPKRFKLREFYEPCHALGLC